MTRSWKTTVWGIATILSALSTTVIALIDGKPETNPDWTATIAAITAGLGLIFARDANVTSEQQGLVPPKTP